jgi:hypothetical protein
MKKIINTVSLYEIRTGGGAPAGANPLDSETFETNGPSDDIGRNQG